MSKIVIVLSEGSREQRNAITLMFNGRGWGLWHRMEDCWLLSNVPDDVTSQQISEEISNNPLIGAKSKVVIKIPDHAKMTYWGHAANKESWEWMSMYWGSAG